MANTAISRRFRTFGGPLSNANADIPSRSAHHNKQSITRNTHVNVKTSCHVWRL